MSCSSVKSLLYFTLFAYILSSCQSPSKLLEKFHKRGGKIECDTTTVTIEKIVKAADGKDSLIYVPVTEYVPQIEYKTKWKTRLEYRFDHKKFEDSLHHIRKMADLDIKKRVKESNSEAKLKDKELKSLKLKLKSAEKREKSSLFWTWVGKRWWILVLLGWLCRDLVRVTLKGKWYV